MDAPEHYVRRRKSRAGYETSLMTHDLCQSLACKMHLVRTRCTVARGSLIIPRPIDAARMLINEAFNGS